MGYICSQMSQLLSNVTQMYGNEAAANIIYNTDVSTTELSIARADLQNILKPTTDAGLYSDHISGRDPTWPTKTVTRPDPAR